MDNQSPMKMMTASLILASFCILLNLKCGRTKNVSVVNIDFLDIQLVNGSALNEGRVLVRWSPGTPWTALCYDQSLDESVNFHMCRRLRYPFACGHSPAGPARTDDASLRAINSTTFSVRCNENPDVVFHSGWCDLMPLNPSLNGSSCEHGEDMWLSCGYAGMLDFELRLIESTRSSDAVGKVLQGRCGIEHEWGAICNNFFNYLKGGPVACRELGFSDYAINKGSVGFGELERQHTPNYTLFEDTGCIGNETSLTECQHYSLRGCLSYLTLSCFNKTKEYEEPAYLCGLKQLCSNQCGRRQANARFHYCQCDDQCVLFDDCCYDHAESCDPGLPLLNRAEFTDNDFECAWLPGSEFTKIGYVVVSRCPNDWTDMGTRDLCERPVDILDVVGSLPVFDEHGLDFKNIFCALCNGRSLDRLQRWDVSASKYEKTPSRFQFYPGLNQILPTKGWLITPPRGHLVIRKCSAYLVDTCLVDFVGSQIEEACQAYYAPIRVDHTKTRYRNPHCAVCNRENVLPENSCVEQVCPLTCDPSPWGPCIGICSPYDDFETIEILFAFSSNSLDGSKSCSEGQIFDPFLNKCRVLTCSSGYQISGDKCVVLPSVPPTFPESTNTSVAKCLSGKDPERNNSGVNVFTKVHIYSQTNPKVASSSIFVLVRSAQEALDFELAFESVVNSTQNITSHNQQLLCNINQLSIVLPFTFNKSSVCTNSTVDGSELLSEYFNGSLLIVTQFKNVSGEQQYSKTKAPPICLQVGELNCSSLLVLEDVEYKIVSETNIDIIATDQRLSAAEYVLLPDGGVVVCSYIVQVEGGLEPQIRRALSFIGSCLSLFALLATFVTYCVFPELRNMAGKSTMNLAAALFTAILLFLLSGVLRLNQGACVFGAAVAHFAWLVAFAWMTVLSFNVARTIGSNLPNRGNDTRIAFIGYVSLSWGVPLVVVIICLILQFCNCTSLPLIYAEYDICWITDTTARLVTFVVPVALSLLANFFLFIFTVLHLRMTRHSSRFARKQGNVDAARQELAIYAKLCCLVGVTWIFGFLSQSVTGIIAFSYIYLILNYLQGVFIFFSFCLNKRARGLWRQKLNPQGASTNEALSSPLKKNIKNGNKSTAPTSSMYFVNTATEDSKL